MIKTSLPQKRRKKCPVFCLCHIADHYFLKMLIALFFMLKKTNIQRFNLLKTLSVLPFHLLVLIASTSN